MKESTIRTILYSLGLVLAAAEAPLGFLLALTSWTTPYGNLSYVFGLLSGILGSIVFVWTCVLLICNNRPNSTNALCQLQAHMISAYILAGLWFCTAILLTSEAVALCPPNPIVFDDWWTYSLRFPCFFSVGGIAAAWLSFIFSLGMAFFLHTRGMLRRFNINVAAATSLGLQSDTASSLSEPPSYSPHVVACQFLDAGRDKVASSKAFDV